MTSKVKESVLEQEREESFELAPTAAAAEKQFEIQSAIIIARRFPRNEDTAFAKLMKACDRTSFAEEAIYSFPRGKIKNDAGESVQNYVEGPSVNLAREAARVWGNIHSGLDILRDDDEARHIRGWAWDLETNRKESGQDEFKKLIQRKGEGGKTLWVKPDERDLRELTNRRGAILERNSLLQVMPKDLIEDAMERARTTLEKGAAQDPEGSRKKIILAFSELNITPEMLEAKLGHSISKCSPAEIAELRKIYKSIADGNSTWAEYVNGHKDKPPDKPGVSVSDLSPGKDENRGHDQDELAQIAEESMKPKIGEEVDI